MVTQDGVPERRWKETRAVSRPLLRRSADSFGSWGSGFSCGMIAVTPAETAVHTAPTALAVTSIARWKVTAPCAARDTRRSEAIESWGGTVLMPAVLLAESRHSSSVQQECNRDSRSVVAPPALSSSIQQTRPPSDGTTRKLTRASAASPPPRTFSTTLDCPVNQQFAAPTVSSATAPPGASVAASSSLVSRNKRSTRTGAAAVVGIAITLLAAMGRAAVACGRLPAGRCTQRRPSCVSCVK